MAEMKILFIGGVFAKENENEIIQNTKTYVEYSANIFQEKLIKGFKENNCDIDVLSAPLIGAYPNAYKKIYFNGFKNKQEKYKYVKFINIWGIRNISRTLSLKKAVKYFIKLPEKDKLIIVYCPHTPFLEAAVYAKKKDKNIKICFVVPDLPQYMNFSEKNRAIYDFFKRIDIKRLNKLTTKVDSFVLLTEHMKYKLNVGDRPYIVIEGIANEVGEIIQKTQKSTEKYIVYTGKMSKKFGIVNLIDAFRLLKNENYRLVLCGTGDAVDYINEARELDSRIIYKGQVSYNEAKEWIAKADVLVNPRQNNEEYTKYSFPSKIIDYLQSGKPVVAYLLDGMPEIYKEFLFIPKDKSCEELANAIEYCIENYIESVQKSKAAIIYLNKNLIPKIIANKLLDIN